MSWVNRVTGGNGRGPEGPGMFGGEQPGAGWRKVGGAIESFQGLPLVGKGKGLGGGLAFGSVAGTLGIAIPSFFLAKHMFHHATQNDPTTKKGFLKSAMGFVGATALIGVTLVGGKAIGHNLLSGLHNMAEQKAKEARGDTGWKRW